MSLGKNLLGISGIILAFGMVAFAQTPGTTTPERTTKRDRMQRSERVRERGMRRHDALDELNRRGGRVGHRLRELDLSAAQREQIRAIAQRRLESTKAQREELLKLREKRTAGTFSDADRARATAL